MCPETLYSDSGLTEDRMFTCSAPGKMILFGEHAVVFGRPALALAIDLRISCKVSPSDQYTVNRHPMKKRHHAYISASLDEAWDGPPINVDTMSEIPAASGLGSSAAVTVSCIASLTTFKGRLEPATIAKMAFEVENNVQGRASPTDTSTSTHGQGVLVSPNKMDNLLWRIEKGSVVWNVHHCDVPRLRFVVGYTGIHAATGPLVAKVKRLVETDDDAKKAIDRIGEIVLAGVDALKKGDKRRIGELMSENHALLNQLGVGHPSLDKLAEACREYSYGTKLTGAGGGGSMIALTDEPDRVSKEIEMAGGEAIPISVGCDGVRIEKRH
jgi:mevalonate kinase